MFLLHQAYQPDDIIAQRVGNDVLISHRKHKKGKEGNQKDDNGVVPFEFEAHGFSPKSCLFFCYISILGFYPVKFPRKGCEMAVRKNKPFCIVLTERLAEYLYNGLLIMDFLHPLYAARQSIASMRRRIWC